MSGSSTLRGLCAMIDENVLVKGNGTAEAETKMALAVSYIKGST